MQRRLNFIVSFISPVLSNVLYELFLREDIKELCEIDDVIISVQSFCPLLTQTPGGFLIKTLHLSLSWPSSNVSGAYVFLDLVISCHDLENSLRLSYTKKINFVF